MVLFVGTYLASGRGPDLQGGIIATAEDTVSVELQACDHVVVMAAQLQRPVYRFEEPPAKYK